MIEVRNLTKRYGSHVAISDLSFTIEKGVIYGFLGPNGAGKSTTMNIITGCLGATEGDVLIDGHSITQEPKAAKQLIGYLPEIPPLYADMTPKEYLFFVLEAKNVPHQEWVSELARVMEKTRITGVQDRLISNLSKGYRQRVGIAQALIGNPEIIILDEPTVGLDPAQIIEIRDLIKELGQEHTIILSSHILSEVQAVCQSIMIISKGHLVASDTAENLTTLLAGSTTIRVEAAADEEAIRDILTKVEGIEDMHLVRSEDGVTEIELTPKDHLDIRPDVFRAFSASEVILLEMTSVHASLEDVFLELTQNEPESETVRRKKLHGKQQKQEVREAGEDA